MKFKFLLLLVMLGMLVGCTSSKPRLKGVIGLKYPNNIAIELVPNKDFSYLVQLPSGEVRYIELLGKRNDSMPIDEITMDVQFFKPVK